MSALLRLGVALSLSYVAIAMASAAGPAEFVRVSGETGLTGAYFGTHALFAAIGALLGGRAMDTWGRRRVLTSAHLVAALGFLVLGYGSAHTALWALFVGVAVVALGIGTVYLTRIAAVELAATGRQAGAMARSQVGATAGAIAGPFLLVAALPLAAALELHGHTVGLLLMPALFLLNALLTASAKGLDSAVRPRDAQRPPMRDVVVPRLPLLAALGALVSAQAVMAGTMGIAVVELGHGGASTGLTTVAVSLHFVGMFAFSLVVGWLADRAGRYVTILIGSLITAGGTLLLAAGDGPLLVGAALVATGLGWSFSYIGGSVLLTDITRTAHRGRIVGAADFASALVTAGASVGLGAWYGHAGIGAVGLVAAALAALPVLPVALARSRRTERAEEAVTLGP